MNKNSKVVAIIQARMGSTRLPSKVLKDIESKTVLARVVNRLRGVRLIDELLIATSDQRADDAIVEECERCSVPVFRGDENDVLDRYFRAAQFCQADIVVRITSDCPLLDPRITEKTIQAFIDQRPDYASNALVRTYPRGLDTEVMTVQALERAWRNATQPYQRAHVTPYIYQNPDEFKILRVTGEADYSNHRWTLDTTEDLEFIRAIYSRLENPEDFGWHDVLDILDRQPELMEMNRSVMQKALHEG
ncbi:MAG TPA: glycosyltransferase family protein [Candidatus Sulfotelmatobacter sp.]